MFLFAGGGTGGHLTPGVAVATAVRRREPGARIVFVGTTRPLERQLIPAEYEHRPLPVESSRTLWRRPWRFAWGNWRAWRAALAMLKADRPRAVVGLGGFASAPVVLAAARLRIPVILLEQNVIPGRATRWLARFASQVCVSFEETVPLLKGRRVVVTGNPVREEIASLAADADCEIHSGPPRTVLVLGGSQGAGAINEAMMAAASAKLLDHLRIVHQTGTEDERRVRAAYEKAAFPHEVAAFFSDMADRYRAADVIVSRAGATTLAEIACAGKPSVLVPYPAAADDHQRHNAKVFVAAGAAEMVEQENDSMKLASGLCRSIAIFLAGEDYARAAEALSGLRHPEAAERVADILLSGAA